MKLSKLFKLVLYPTLLALYFSGVIVWVLNRWFPINRGFGPETNPTAISLLHVHSVVSLWFLILFGYLWRSHVERGLKAKRKVTSGLSLVLPVGLLFLTAPALFYLTDEKQKLSVVWIHTYVGLALPLVFFTHYFTKVKKKGKH